MSSLVSTYTEAATSVSRCGRLDTDVISTFIRPSSVNADRSGTGVWAKTGGASPTRATEAHARPIKHESHAAAADE